MSTKVIWGAVGKFIDTSAAIEADRPVEPKQFNQGFEDISVFNYFWKEARTREAKQEVTELRSYILVIPESN